MTTNYISSLYENIFNISFVCCLLLISAKCFANSIHVVTENLFIGPEHRGVKNLGLGTV